MVEQLDVKRCAVLLLFFATATGCVGPAADRSRLMSAPPLRSTDAVTVTSHAAPAVAAPYQIDCPDVLAVSFADAPQADRLAAVDLDGRLPLDHLARPRVAGLTLDAARDVLARAAGVDPRRVTVTLADPRAGRVSVFGPERNRQRSVAFVGPERLTEFLGRVGAVTPGCTDWRDVCVVRPNVAAGEKTQVFRADLEAIVRDGDPATDVVLRAGDQVYVGETRRSRLSRRLPDWLTPWYRAAAGLVPAAGLPSW